MLDKPLTVKENLKSRAALYGITGQAFEKRLQELLDILDFGDYLTAGHKIVRRAEKKDRHCESIAPQTGDPYFR